jgi:hypothetical protein
VEHAARLGFLLCALALAPTLAAKDPEPDPVPDPVTHYGVRLTAALPRQDFQQLTGRTGLGLGLFAETQCAPGTLVQSRLDYISYPQTNAPGRSGASGYIPAAPLTLSVDSLSCGFDVRHDLPYRALKSAYLMAGVMAVRYEFQSSAAGILEAPDGTPSIGIIRYKSKNSLKLGWALGLGYELDDHWSLSERYTTVDIDGITLAAWETSLNYRF